MTEVPTGRADRDLWWSIGRAILAPVMAALFRIRVHGLENVPAEGGAILAANHVSVLDPIVHGLVASRRGRTVRFIGTSETWNQRFVGWGLRRIRQIPIERGRSDVAALRDAARIVRAGAVAGIYPEGRVGPGEMLRVRRGAARLALMSGGPLVPVGTWGTNARWPVTGLHFRRPWRPVVAVVVARPIPADGDPESAEAVDALTERLGEALGVAVDRARTIARVP